MLGAIPRIPRPSPRFLPPSYQPTTQANGCISGAAAQIPRVPTFPLFPRARIYPKKPCAQPTTFWSPLSPSLSRDGQLFWGTRNYGPQVSYHTSPWPSVTISHGFRDSCSVRFATAPFCHNLGTAYPGRDCISGCNAFSHPSPCVPSF